MSKEQQQPVEEMPTNMANFLRKNQVEPEKPAVEKTEEPKAEVPTEEVKPEEVKPTDGGEVKEQPKEEVAEVEANNDWMNLEAAPATQTQEQPTAQSPEGTLTVDQKAEILDGLVQDPEIQLLMEVKKNGGTLADLFNDYQPVDYTKMSPEAVAKHYGELKGWSEEDIQEIISEFEDMKSYQKKEAVEKWITTLEASQGGKREKLTEGIKTRSAESQKEAARIEAKFIDDVEKEASFIVDKPLFGTKMTKEDAEDFKAWVNTFDFLNPDGTYNVPMLRNFWIGARKIPAIQKANYSQGTSDGRLETLKEVHRPSDNSAAATKLPDQQTPLTDVEKAQRAMKQFMGGGRVLQ